MRAPAIKRIAGNLFIDIVGHAAPRQGKINLAQLDMVDKADSARFDQAPDRAKVAVVAAIVSEGVASWDSRIVDIDPSFQLYDAYPTAQVTVRDLFSHRSGLPGGAGNELEEIGFDNVRENRVIATPTGSISLYSGRKA